MSVVVAINWFSGVVSLYGKKGVGQFKAWRFDLFRFLSVDIVLVILPLGD